MKTIKTLLILIFISLIGCIEAEKEIHEFLAFLKKYEMNSDIMSKNPLVQNEAIKERDISIVKYMDSVVIIKDLPCKFKRLIIHNEKKDNQTIEIGFKVLGASFLNLDCYYSFHKDSVENDYLYNKFKELKEDNKYYIDGFISKNYKENKPNYTYQGTSYSFLPSIRFYLIDFNKELENSLHLSDTLLLQLSQFREVVQLVYNNENMDKHNYDNLGLSGFEKEYAQKYYSYIVSDMLKSMD